MLAAPIAGHLKAAGVPVPLVSDSVGVVETGFSSTCDVTVDHICYHVGAGPAYGGQVLVINDAIGLGDNWPPFSRQYAYTAETVTADRSGLRPPTAAPAAGPGFPGDWDNTRHPATPGAQYRRPSRIAAYAGSGDKSAPGA